MAVAVSLASNEAFTASGTSASRTGRGIGTAAADRLIFALISYTALDSSSDINSLTIGGISATRVRKDVTAEHTFYGCISGSEIWWAAVPTGTTATFAFGYDTNFGDIQYVVYAVTGADTTTPVSANTGATRADALTNAVSNTLTILDNGAALGNAFGVGASTSATVAWTYLTEDFDNDLNSPGFEALFGHSTASRTLTTGVTSQAITATFTGSGLVDNQRGLTTIAIQAASGGGGGDGVGSASGTATVTGVGASLAAATGAASGTATATAVGRSTAASVGSASSTGTATAVGVTAIQGAGSASGTATVLGVGAFSADASGAGSATGTATVTAVGAALSAAVGTATGTGTATAVGASTAAAVGTASGTATVSGVGDSQQAGTAVGTASGSATVIGVGASIAAAVGTASGTASVNGVSVDEQPIPETPVASGGGGGGGFDLSSYKVYERKLKKRQKQRDELWERKQRDQEELRQLLQEAMGLGVSEVQEDAAELAQEIAAVAIPAPVASYVPLRDARAELKSIENEIADLKQQIAAIAADEAEEDDIEALLLFAA